MADIGIAERPAEATAIYRHFDASGKLLYVGISLSPTYRLSQHRGCSPWFQEIASITIEWCPTREAALKTERQAIKSEAPEFNIVHNKGSYFDEAMDDQIAESCVELTRKVSRFGSCYRTSEAASAIGVRAPHLRLAMAAGELPYYPTGRHLGITGWAVIGYLEALQVGAVRVRRQEVREDGSLRRPPNDAWLSENFGNVSLAAWYAFEDANYEPLAVPLKKAA